MKAISKRDFVNESPDGKIKINQTFFSSLWANDPMRYNKLFIVNYLFNFDFPDLIENVWFWYDTDLRLTGDFEFLNNPEPLNESYLQSYPKIIEKQLAVFIAENFKACVPSLAGLKDMYLPIRFNVTNLKLKCVERLWEEKYDDIARLRDIYEHDYISGNTFTEDTEYILSPDK